MHSWCGVSVDTRVALRGDGGGRYDTLRCGEAVSRPKVADDLRTGESVVTPLTAVRASINASEHHPGIYRHPTPGTQCPTPQKAHQSPHPRAAPFRDLAAVWAAPTVLRSGLSGLKSMTHGSHLRLAEVRPQELEHFIPTRNRVDPPADPSAVTATRPLHVSRWFCRSSGAPAKVHIFAPLSTVNHP